MSDELPSSSPSEPNASQPADRSHDGPNRPRRRRGTRGGSRNGGSRNSGAGPSTNSPADESTRNPEMPDLPWEGVPGGRGDQPKPEPRKQRQGERPQPSAKQGGRPPEARSKPTRTPGSEAEGTTDGDGASKPEQKADAKSDAKSDAKPNGQSDGGRPRNRRTGSRDGRTKRAPINPNAEYTMCVHVRSNATQIAVLEGRSLIEHYVSHAEDDVSQIHGNIYLGKVQNVLPGMEAAFVDIATPKNAVLYRGDVQFDRKDLDAPAEFKEARIEQLLKNGQLVICQVTKNPIAAKGARLTQEVSLAGRFVVLVPNSSTYGISTRLPDDERKRLRGVLDQVKPAHHGIIVRTAASGADADELRRDVQSLVKHWDEIAGRAAKLRGPALLHREPNLAVRIIREEFSAAYQRVVIDDVDVYQEVRRYVESITPELADRIELFDTTVESLPVFEKFHVHEQLHKAIDRKVWLPSGGSIIIERTEALTVIDVNTGKNVGSTSLEETVYRNNLEAATEIARQLRLRDIGGIIVIDFIDMEIKPNRAAVVAHFRSELSKDKTRTQVFEISDLGLVEMTRKRISEGLIEALSDTCPTCNGRGFVFDPNVLEE